MTCAREQPGLWRQSIHLCLECGADVALSALVKPGERVRPAVWRPWERAFLCSECGGLEIGGGEESEESEESE